MDSKWKYAVVAVAVLGLFFAIQMNQEGKGIDVEVEKDSWIYKAKEMLNFSAHLENISKSIKEKSPPSMPHFTCNESTCNDGSSTDMAYKGCWDATITIPKSEYDTEITLLPVFGNCRVKVTITKSAFSNFAGLWKTCEMSFASWNNVTSGKENIDKYCNGPLKDKASELAMSFFG